MDSDNKQTAEKVFRRHKGWRALFLLIVALLFVGVNLTGFFVFQDYDFSLKNDAAYRQYLSIDSHSRNERQVSALTVADVERLRNEPTFQGVATVSVIQQIPFGIPSSLGEDSVFLTAYDDELATQVFGAPLADETVTSFRDDSTKDGIKLSLPVIDASEDESGFISSSSEDVSLALKKSDYNHTLLTLIDPTGEYFVSPAELAHIAETMHTKPVVDSVVLHVNTAAAVDAVAQRLDQLGYNYADASQFFSERPIQLLEVAGLAVLPALALFILISVLLVSFFSSYVKHSGTDIARLRRDGYTTREIAGLYLREFSKLFGFGLGISVVSLIVLGFFGGQLPVALGLLLSEIVLTAILLLFMWWRARRRLKDMA